MILRLIINVGSSNYCIKKAANHTGLSGGSGGGGSYTGHRCWNTGQGYLYRMEHGGGPSDGGGTSGGDGGDDSSNITGSAVVRGGGGWW